MNKSRETTNKMKPTLCKESTATEWGWYNWCARMELILSNTHHCDADQMKSNKSDEGGR